MKAWLGAVLAAAALAAAGCAGADLEQAQGLAETGEESAAALRDEAGATAGQFALFANRFALKRRLISATTTEDPLTAEMITAEVSALEDEIFSKARELTSILRSRERMLGDLAETYRAFGVLVAFDSAGETRAAFDKFAGSANGFIGAVAAAAGGPAAIVPAFVAPAARGVVVFAAEARHKRSVVEASRQIRHALVLVRDALRQEADYAVAVRQDSLIDRLALRNLMFEAGLAMDDLTPIVDEAARLANVELVGDVEGAIAAKPNVGAALRSYRARVERTEVALIAEAYELSLGVFDELIARHLRLEHDQPFDFARLDALIARLLALGEEIRAAATNG